MAHALELPAQPAGGASCLPTGPGSPFCSRSSLWPWEQFVGSLREEQGTEWGRQGVVQGVELSRPLPCFPVLAHPLQLFRFSPGNSQVTCNPPGPSGHPGPPQHSTSACRRHSCPAPLTRYVESFHISHPSRLRAPRPRPDSSSNRPGQWLSNTFAPEPTF